MPTGSPPTSPSGWAVTGLCMPAGLAISGAYVYAAHIVDDGGQQVWILKINTDGTYTEYPVFGNETLNSMTADGEHLYTSSYGSDTQITVRSLTDVSYIANFSYQPWGTGNFQDNGFGDFQEIMATPTPPTGIVILGEFVYAVHANDGYNAGGVLSRINKNPFMFTQDTSFGSAQGYLNPGGLTSPAGITTDGTYLYIGNNGANNILRMNSDGTGLTTFKSGLGSMRGLSFFNGYIYVSLTSTIVKIQISDPTNMTTVVSVGLDNPLQLVVSSGNIYVSNASNSQRSNFPITISGFIGRYNDVTTGGAACFKHDTKILTDHGYIPIQDLKRGDLVQTIKNGLQEICLIGKSQMVHNKDSSSEDQLYKCSNSKYPEVFEDLVMTGAHAILVRSFKEGEREEVQKFYGKIFITDPMYRLPVCLDKRALIYEDEGEHTIYHIALENDDIYTNYGIYANGLLVESCSKNYLMNVSNMSLL